MKLLRQSTAFIFRIGPFKDDADFKTAETLLSIAQADIQISKDGGAFAQTSDASPTTTHDKDGWYQCPLTATDTNTLGLLRVEIAMSGALDVWDDFMVVPAEVYDTLVDGTDALPAQVEGMDSDVITAAAIASGAIDADALATDAVNEIVDQVWDEAEADHTSAGSFGEAVNNIEDDAASLNATKIPDTLSLANINAQVDTALSDIGLDHLLSAAVVGADVTDNSIFAYLVSKSATADWDDYDNEDDSLQALRDELGEYIEIGVGYDSTNDHLEVTAALHRNGTLVNSAACTMDVYDYSGQTEKIDNAAWDTGPTESTTNAGVWYAEKTSASTPITAGHGYFVRVTIDGVTAIKTFNSTN